MSCFSDKVRDARLALKLSQQRLADMVGVSVRSIIKYEVEGTMPRKSVMSRLAEALRVSEQYLSDDGVSDPLYGTNMTPQGMEVAAMYGERAGREMEFLLQRNAALFAGGSLSQGAKDEFFEAIMTSYITCKEAAKKRGNIVQD